MELSENQDEGPNVAIGSTPQVILSRSKSLPRRRVGRIFLSDKLRNCGLKDQEQPEQDDLKDNNQSTHEEEEEDDDEEDALLAKSPTKSNDYRRMMATHEIIQSEVDYVDDLIRLRDHFILPMEQEQVNVLQDAQAAVFCNNLKQIVMLNSKLRDDLMTVVNFDGYAPTSQTTQAATVGAIFCRYAPLFKLYASYAKDFDDVTKLFRDAGLREFLESCMKKASDTHTFQSYLIRPIQRVPRYKLLLNRLMENTDLTDLDLPFLTQAIEKVTEAAQLINETIRQHENLETVLATQAKFGGTLSLFTGNRRLIRHGKLLKVSRKRPEQVMLHLFNDLLLYSDMLPGGGFRLRRTVHLASSTCSVSSHAPASYAVIAYDGRRLKKECGFTITSSEKSFMLFASTREDQQSWTSSIKEAMEAAQKVEQEDTVKEATGNAPAALWVPDSVAENCSVCSTTFTMLFRRHHCRRCGSVVCGYCSRKRAVILGTDDPKERRVCTYCFRVLDLVKRMARKWRSLLIKHQGWLRRKRWHKWSRYYFEVHKSILYQYAVGPEDRNSNTEPLDELELTGTIVIHRSDRAQKYPYCFQIAFPDMLASSPAEKRRTSIGGGGRAGSESRLSEEIRGSSFDAAFFHFPDTGWILCGDSAAQEAAWMTAMQSAGDIKFKRARRSRSLGTACLEAAEARLTERSIGRTSEGSMSDDHCETKHHYILKEIVRSEHSYVTSLGECMKVYVQPLLLQQQAGQQFVRQMRQNKSRSSSKLLNRKTRKLSASPHLLPSTNTQRVVLDADMAVFFNSIEQIYTLNCQLLDQLMQHLAETEKADVAVHRVGEIFTAYAPLFNLYTAYASRYEAALAALDGEEFAVMLSELGEGVTLLQLKSYLNMPMDRIPRYKVLLQELLECTGTEHVDYDSLQSAIEKVNAVVQLIDDKIAERENHERITRLERAYGISFKGRRILREGLLRKVCRRFVKEYHFVLMDHALMYGHVASQSSYKLHRAIELKDCKVNQCSSETPSNYENSFYFFSQAKSFVIVANSEEECEDWVTEIQDCIDRVSDPARNRLMNNLSQISQSSDSPIAIDDETILKHGWMKVKKRRNSGSSKMWLSVRQQALMLSSEYKSTQPDAVIPISSCKILSDNSTSFNIIREPDTNTAPEEYTVYASSAVECQQWVQVLRHCAEGSIADYVKNVTESNQNEANLAPVFVTNSAAKSCMICCNSFALYRRRHHCRGCGSLVCGSCSRNKVVLSNIDSKKLSRVCDDCVCSGKMQPNHSV